MGLRRLSSYIHDNYASPNIKDIEQARRRREIEEIDEMVQKKKSDQFVKSSTVGEIIEQHPTSVDKQDFRKSHSYVNPKTKASGNALGKNLKLNL